MLQKVLNKRSPYRCNIIDSEVTNGLDPGLIVKFRAPGKGENVSIFLIEVIGMHRFSDQWQFFKQPEQKFEWNFLEKFQSIDEIYQSTWSNYVRGILQNFEKILFLCGFYTKIIFKIFEGKTRKQYYPLSKEISDKYSHLLVWILDCLFLHKMFRSHAFNELNIDKIDTNIKVTFNYLTIWQANS